MKKTEFEALVGNDMGYLIVNPNDVNTTVRTTDGSESYQAIDDEITIGKRVGAIGFKIVAYISMTTTGQYRIETKIPNKLANAIRKYANTDIKDRMIPEVAILGKDKNVDDNGWAIYTAYTTDGDVCDEVTTSELTTLTPYHFDGHDKQVLIDRLTNEYMPQPRFIPIDEIDNNLKATE